MSCGNGLTDTLALLFPIHIPLALSVLVRLPSLLVMFSEAHLVYFRPCWYL